MTPDISFVFKDMIEEIIKTNKIVIDNKPDLDTVKGITLKQNGTIFINLSAYQWKFLGEDALINELTNTIIHENIHSSIKDYTSIGANDTEERVCMILANQLE